ncbi:MAG: hypothetical protein H7A46_19540 [Verrucomicrobiales bacterium]|nr:hypothetical protein [Verrucomicrobiales bacterium]
MAKRIRRRAAGGRAKILLTLVAQAAHIPAPSGGTTVDAEARAAINAILAALEGKGVVAGS